MTKGINFFVFLVALIAGFGGFMYGFDSSVVADVKDQVIHQLNISDWQWSQVVSVSLLGCIVGIPISGFFSDRLSRKILLKTTALGFIAGSLLCALSTNFTSLICGRFIIGVCIGIASYIAPLFIAEIAPPNRRGTLILMNGLTITFGQAMAYLMGYFLHDYSISSWRYLFIISCIPALILFTGMFFVPHSPRWIMKKAGLAQALHVLKRIRPAGYDIEVELAEIQTNLSRSPSNNRLLFKNPILGVLLIGVALGIFQQCSGINAIIYYGPVIFASAGFFPMKQAILATFFIGMVNFIFTMVTLLCIDKLGRRYLLLSGTLIASISLCTVSFLFNHPFPGQKLWILAALSFYVIGYCISLGSLFWVIVAELYPLPVRGLAMSIATVMQCAANFLVSISFLTLYHSLGSEMIFLLFGIICFTAYLFIYAFIPETKGVSLEKIENDLMSGMRIRDIGFS